MTVKPCLLCRQSEEIREAVIEMAKRNTYIEIIAWLKERGIIVSAHQLPYFLRKVGVPVRSAITPPMKTPEGRFEHYIETLLEYEGETYTIHNLGMHGSSWTDVTRRLHAAGLIEKMRNYTPRRWRIIASKDDIQTWYEDWKNGRTPHWTEKEQLSSMNGV